MSKIKPVYLMHENGLNQLEKQAVLDGTKELLRIGEVEHLISIADFGVWKNKYYHNLDGCLNAYQSVDWYLQEAKITSRNQINGDKIIDLLQDESWQKGEQEHYDILITSSDMYFFNTNFVIGTATPWIGTPPLLRISPNIKPYKNLA